MNQQFKRLSSGFTIIELMLAMGFISLLMLAIAMLTIHISTIYNQGITLREVNQAGLAISEDVQRTIGATAPFVVDPSKGLNQYIPRDGGGRLCTGSHSYVWNYSTTEYTPSPSLNIYTGGVDTPISLVKVVDPDRSLCQNPTEDINVDDANELLASGDRNLVLYEFKITSPAEVILSSGQALYVVDFTIGTKGTDIVDSVNKICKPPSESDRSREYCAMNKFSITVRAGSQAGGR